MRQFATNRHRSDLVIRSRKSGQVVDTIKPHQFYRYHGNATAVSEKAINRKRRK